jgi:hypothetical protein
MSFNFSAFISAMTQMLPAVGQAVEALHPGDDQEALKINVGTALITGIATALQSAPSAPAAALPANAVPAQ